MQSARAAVAENRFARLDLADDMAPEIAGNFQRGSSHTITGLKRWSVINKELPAVSQVKAIHVYDFDNTLFSSPLPNPQLWNGPTIGFLQAWESFANGGWWHDPNLLSATGDGIEKEEPRAWNGWWNEQIVQLVQLSMQQKDALTVLLTGRSESGFADIIKRMVTSKKLEFDMICLKPEAGPNNERFPSTIAFKQILLEDLILTYKQADEIRVYEDRVKHVKGFRDFFVALNRKLQQPQGSQTRKPINGEVIQVAEECVFLDPVVEAAEVQRMINAHNLSLKNPALNVTSSPYGRLRIKRTVFYTGYLVSSADSARLISQILNPILPNGLAESNDLKYMANNVLITPRPAPKSILDKVGGLGRKFRWQVTGTGVFENKVWAARVAPVPPTETYYTDNPSPFVVLAVRKGVRPIDAGKIHNWQPVAPDQAMILDTVVGEKVVLRVEEENPNEGEWESQFLNKNHKRRHQQERDEDILYPQSNPSGTDMPSHGRPYPYYHRHVGDNRRGNDEGYRRGGSSRGRGRGRGSGSGTRGRGNFNRGGRGGRGRGHSYGPSGYRSLDGYVDHEPAEEQRSTGGGAPFMNY